MPTLNTNEARAILHCTNNDRENECEVGIFNKEKFFEAYIAGNRIRMTWNGKRYVGNAHGLEFTSEGPKTYDI